MKKNEGFVQVGKVKDAHGIKGELFIVLFAGEAAWLGKLKELRLTRAEPIEEPNEHKTLNVRSARLHKNGLIIKTEELKDRNQAEALKGWMMEIPDSFLVSEKGETIYLREVLGFRVFTKHKGEVGTIQGFASNGAQDLLVVQTAWGEFEIPFVQPYIENLDFDAREIHLDLPEGLLGEDIQDDEVK